MGKMSDSLVAAQEAAERRLAACNEALFDDELADEACGAYCGCDTCVVREVLDAAFPHIERYVLEQASDATGTVVPLRSTTEKEQ